MASRIVLILYLEKCILASFYPVKSREITARDPAHIQVTRDKKCRTVVYCTKFIFPKKSFESISYYLLSFIPISHDFYLSEILRRSYTG